MASLICPDCSVWVADVDDTSWRVTKKAEGVILEPSLTTSADLWSNLEVVEKRADEWRDRGVYDPMPPPPDPANSSVMLQCRCGERTRFEKP